MAETGFNIEIDSRTFNQVESAYDAMFVDLNAKANQALPQIKKDLMSMLLKVMRKLERAHGQPWQPVRSSRKKNLYRRSGEGLRDIRASIEVTGSSLSELKGVIDPIGYMETQEDGGVMTPRRSKYMTIPLPAALDASGNPRKRSARDWDRTFVQTSKNGSLLIFQRRGRRIVPLYVLRQRVVVPPRLGLQRRFDEELPYFENKAFDRIAEVLAR